MPLAKIPLEQLDSGWALHISILQSVHEVHAISESERADIVGNCINRDEIDDKPQQ